MVDKMANPAPLGLMAFGMTTILLNIHNAGFYPNSSMILAMGIFFGGLAQVIAGLLEFKCGNTFGMTAFTSYGMFWLTLVSLWVMPAMGLADAPGLFAMGCYLAVWGLFTAFMFFGTLRTNRVLQFVFASLALLFFLLAAGDFTGIPVIKTIAGYEGIICGFSAFYLSVAEVINGANGKSILPIFPVKK